MRRSHAQTHALERIHERQLVDDFEMAEILANEELLDRLRRGSRQARQGKGRFVD